MAILQERAQYVPQILEIETHKKSKEQKNAQGAVNDTSEGENYEILKKKKWFRFFRLRISRV